MKYFFTPLFLCTIICLATPAFAWQQTKSDAADSENQPLQLTSSELAKLIEQLDSDKFLLREQATEQLMRTSSAVIPSLYEAASNGSLEKGIRCIHILKEFAIGDDIPAEIEAIKVLTNLTTGKNARIANYSRDVLRRVQPIHAERAIRILNGLGVQFGSFRAQGFTSYQRGPRIKIDDNYSGTDEQLYYLRHLNFIRDVQISGNRVNKEMLSQIAMMPNVHLMTIKDAPVDDQKLKALSPILNQLTAVHFYYLPLTDKSLPLLKKLTSLNKAEYYGLEISKESQAELMKVYEGNENVLIDFRNGGFLGVTSRDTSSAYLSEVHKDGGAYAAGIRSQDKVIEVDGDPINIFSDLTNHLKEKNVGDKIKVKVIRKENQPDQEELTMIVSLGKWPMREDY